MTRGANKYLFRFDLGTEKFSYQILQEYRYDLYFVNIFGSGYPYFRSKTFCILIKLYI